MASAYYVDGLAANGGDGTLATPWNCLDQVSAYSAMLGFQPGDVVFFKRGTTIAAKTAGALTIANSGTEDDPIVFRDYGTGALPIIDCGGVPVSGAWVEQSANGLPGVYCNSYSGSVVNGFTEDSVWLKHAATMASIGQGQWYWNSTSNPSHLRDTAYAVGVYYRPTNGTPANHILRKCSNNNGVGIGANHQHLTFKYLHLKGGAFGIATGRPTNTHLRGITIVGCTFSELRTAVNLAGYGTWRTQGFLLKGNTVTNCGKGLFIGSGDTGAYCEDHTVSSNTVANIDLDQRFSSFGTFLDREAMSIQNPVGCRVQGNTMAYGAPHGGLILWVHPTQGKFAKNLIAANDLHDIDGSGLVLGAAVNAPSAGYNVVCGNRVVRVSEYGIKINTTSTFRPSYCTNNVVEAAGLANYYTQTTCAGWEVQNNISVSPVTYHASWGGASTCRPNANCYWPVSGACFHENGLNRTWDEFKAEVYNNGVTAPPPDDVSVSCDPQFQAGTYRLSPTSPLKTGGLYATHAAVDGDGLAFTTMMIGAY